jgi:hypothetical protein
VTDRGRFDVLSDKQERALAALTRGASQDEAAREAGASARSVRRWMASPAFTARLRGARDAAFAATLDALAQLGAEAVAVLRASMEPGNEAPLRLRAAIAALELAAKSRGDDLAERVAELERRLLVRSAA